MLSQEIAEYEQLQADMPKTRPTRLVSVQSPPADSSQAPPKATTRTFDSTRVYWRCGKEGHWRSKCNAAPQKFSSEDCPELQVTDNPPTSYDRKFTEHKNAANEDNEEVPPISEPASNAVLDGTVQPPTPEATPPRAVSVEALPPPVEFLIPRTPPRRRDVAQLVHQLDLDTSPIPTTPERANKPSPTYRPRVPRLTQDVPPAPPLIPIAGSKLCSTTELFGSSSRPAPRPPTPPKTPVSEPLMVRVPLELLRPLPAHQPEDIDSTSPVVQVDRPGGSRFHLAEIKTVMTQC
ncbi:hypothetical protein CBL_20444 [Carabus blaptoides fortunei]